MINNFDAQHYALLSWSYYIGDKDESRLDYNFADTWHDETEITPRNQWATNFLYFGVFTTSLLVLIIMFGMEVIGPISHWEAKHYESWTAIKSAQHQLQFNLNFKAKRSEIKAIFKP